MIRSLKKSSLIGLMCTRMIVRYARNEVNSPVFELLNMCKAFDIFDMCIAMINGGCYLSKDE